MTLPGDVIQRVWEKGRAAHDRDPTEWRKDQCGAWLHREQYENEDSEYGWKIEKVTPGGPDVPDNLQPFHRDNTFDIETGRPHCRVSADRAELSPVQHVEPPRNAPL